MTAPSRAGARRAVLVVDDDDRVRAVVRAVLEADDFEVTEAADGASALQLLAEGGAGPSETSTSRPHVLVLDVMMPGMDGIEVCRQIDHRTTRVLMLTAREDLATREASVAAGADAFLAKPFSAVELLDAIEALSSDDTAD
ncbi:MAG TPA: response regulator [Acidimicrobiales bacterium]|jgi:DNA-binding response OmpR family regulator|nr:response regulator [Acidimicrobiales bacterium]